jgi:hypothetical protein
MADNKSNNPKTGLPPNLSVKIPIGKRKIAQVNTGIPINHPISAGPQSNAWISTRKVTRAPLSIQHAKQMVNAKVLRTNTKWAFLSIISFILQSRLIRFIKIACNKFNHSYIKIFNMRWFIV